MIECPSKSELLWKQDSKIQLSRTPGEQVIPEDGIMALQKIEAINLLNAVDIVF